MRIEYTGRLVAEDATIGLCDGSYLVGYEISLHNQLPDSCLLQSEVQRWVHQQLELGLFDIAYSVECDGEWEYMRDEYYKKLQEEGYQQGEGD